MNMDNAAAALKKYFGYTAFRPLQADVIQSVYEKRDVLVLMPTGGGKSMCYQIPAVTLDGVAIVLSPLIALMKDQVGGLRANGIPAAFLNSSLDGAQSRAVENAVLSGEIKILYVSPEKMVSQGFQPLLKSLKISLFAIDEAHCISSWGHDFRPEYTQLKFLKTQFPQVPIIALTATADKLTRKDILDQLGLPDPRVFIASFDRPNISLRIKPAQKRLEQIVEILKKHNGQSGIIYCLSRKNCMELTEKLVQRGFNVQYYHAELSQAQRSKVQDDFINDRVPVIVATVAFGMGIDKSNVRFIIHYNMPGNMERYYQEIGRAGRDGLPAEATLFYSYSDVQTYRNMFEDGEGETVQKELKIAKLNRMFQFAEALVCRRKTILNYFNEPYDDNCGNCDVCLNPPRQFDGTVAAQKALSAILRTGEKVAMTMLVNILRGSQNRDLMDQGYHQIKTYGAGKEYSFEEWMFIIAQMLHNGLVDIAYDDHNRLRVTEAGKSILYHQKRVSLALPPENATEPKLKPGARATGGYSPAGERPKSTAQLRREELFQLLVEVRRKVAQEQGVPPYLIFSDATLEEMAEKRPLTDADLMRISGVGERKLQRYADAFLEEIRRFVLERTQSGENVPGATALLSFQLFQKGQTVEQIAETRQLHANTIMGHLATMYERGENLDISPWIGPEELDIIQGALSLFDEPYQLKPVFEHFEQRYDYDKIRLAIADFNRKKAAIERL